MKKVETLEEFLNLDYEIKITPFYEDGEQGYVVTCPEIKSIEVYGESIEEALEELKEAKIAIYEMSQELGEVIYYPKKYYTFDRRSSGRLTVRLPVQLHDDVKDYAEYNLVSLNTAIIQLVNNGLQANDNKALFEKLSNIEEVINDHKKINLVYQIANQKVNLPTSYDYFDVGSVKEDVSVPKFYPGMGLDSEH